MVGWSIADLLWWRVADRKLQGRRGHFLWRSLLAAFMLLQIAYLWMLFGGSILDHVPTVHPIYWPVCAYIWHLFLIPASALVSLVLSVRSHLKQRPQTPSEDGQIPDAPKRQAGMTRREVLGLLGVAAPPIISAAVAIDGTAGLGCFRIRDLILKIPQLPEDLEGQTIAQVSDLHIGRFLPDGTAQRVADATNAMRADLVVFTGDLVDLSCEDPQLGIDFLRQIDPRNGLTIIEGNHDLMRGVDWIEKLLRDKGWPLLLDESRTFRLPGRSTPIQMLGIAWGELKQGRELGIFGADADRWFRHPSESITAASVQRVANLRDKNAFPILLAHHPHALDSAADAGLPLVLAGHTHGGQIMLTRNIGAGPLRFRYWAGEYQKKNSTLFVNNGVGNWFPLRINAPSEIVKIILTRS
jgi:predicted MPP superfamily phosphohydrolase